MGQRRYRSHHSKPEIAGLEFCITHVRRPRLELCTIVYLKKNMLHFFYSFLQP